MTFESCSPAVAANPRQPIDPEIAAMLEQLKALPPFESLEVEDARAMVAELGVPVAEGGDPPIEMRTIAAPWGQMPVRIYRPDGAVGLIVYYHGGGWTMGDLDSLDATLRRFAIDTGCCIASVGYRLAPEHPFPAAVIDAMTAASWAHLVREALVGRDAPLLVAGDSAGANLATVVALAAKQTGRPKLAGQILLYPVTDTDLDTASYLEHGEGKFLTRNLMRWFFDHYLPDGIDRTDSRVAPLRSSDLAGLPPTFIQIAEHDPLHDEGEAYARKMMAAGVDVTLDQRPGLIHGYFGMVGAIEAATAAADDAAAWVRGIVAPGRS